MNSRTILVTGGGSGIGAETSRHLAASGATVLVADIDPVAGNRTVAEIEAQGGRARAMPCDITRPEDCARAASAARSSPPVAARAASVSASRTRCPGGPVALPTSPRGESGSSGERADETVTPPREPSSTSQDESASGGPGDSVGAPDPSLPVARPRLDESFPRCRRLTREAEFRRVLARGFRHSTPHLVIHLLATELGHARLGLTIPKKVGTAVVRNRVRRRVREAFRRLWRPVADARPADIVVRVLPGAGAVPFEELAAAGIAALEAWKRAGFREGGRRPKARS